MNPGDQIDRYIVEAELGRGGMAVVYRVRHETLDSIHALKVLHADQPVIAERLIQEGKLQASLRHPNVVAVTDTIVVNGMPGLVMEYLPDGALDDLLDSELDRDLAMQIFREVCAGVAHAHSLGMVHRDLKPANVLLQKIDGRYIAKVADFGLAKVLGSGGDGIRKTRSGIAMGTPAYMAPEQVRDAASVDARADIWALGAMLFELVRGRRLFTGPGSLEVMNAVVSGPNPRHLAELEPPVRTAVTACVQPNLKRRIPNCATLLEVLDGGSWRADEAGGTWDPLAEGDAGITGDHEIVARPESAETTTWDPAPASDPTPAGEPTPEPTPPRPVAVRRVPPLRAARWLVLAVPVFMALTNLFDAVDGRVQYPLLRAIHGEIAATDVVVVGLSDAQDLRALRTSHPDVIDALVEAEATAIVFDVSFQALDDADSAFAQAIDNANAAGVPVISAVKFRDNQPLHPGTPALREAVQGGIVRLEYDLLFANALKARVRQQIIDGETLWNVSVEAVRAHLGRNANVAIEGRDLVIGSLRNPVHAEISNLHPTAVPTEIPYGTDMSAAKGKMAFIGVTSGPDDLHRTPDGSRYGVSVLASFAQTLLRQQCTQSATPEQNMLATLIAGMGTGLLATRLKRRAQPLALVVAAGVVAVAIALASAGVMLSIIPPALAGFIGLWAARKAP